MSGATAGNGGEVVLSCDEVEPTLAFLRDRLGFRLLAIRPADAPRVARLEGHGLRVRLEVGATAGPGHLRWTVRDAADACILYAPNGTRIELAPPEEALVVPPLVPRLVVRHARGDEGWVTGRAGMQYRDLLPDRQGGRFVASHLRIPRGGEVPDYVHFHEVRFQWIHCLAGWVRVVYEDQGEPFELRAGEGVLQPPRIRHRVLACSDGLEVLEVGCPADHETRAEHDLTLPTARLAPERDFSGQRFVRYTAATGHPRAWRHAGFRARELGLRAASGGLVHASDVRPDGTPPDGEGVVHDGELALCFVAEGAVTLEVPGRPPERLERGAACAVPAGVPHAFRAPTGDLELLEACVPVQAL